jgi:hypothetical protein
MTKDEALKLALEALGWTDEWRPQGLKEEAIATIKEALAQPEQEPAACKECHLKDTVYDLLGDLKVANLKLSVRAQRTWVEVTDEEREQVINANTATGLWYMAKAIEAKLKEKNT